MKALEPGQRVRKRLWETVHGIVLRRNDYTAHNGTIIESYDVQWLPTPQLAYPADLQAACWRAHTRPEGRAWFVLMRFLGRRPIPAMPSGQLPTDNR